MLGLFPASGALGGSIASQLVGTCNVPAKSLTFIARHPAKLDKYKDQGVTVRQADYDAHETLVHAFDGVDTLCLISYASIQNDHRFESHKRAIDAARASGVMQAHLRTEAYLREVAAKDPAFTYTVVREGLYTESFGLYTAFFSLSSPTSPIRIPHDGSAPGVAWAKLEDLGEATARVLRVLSLSETVSLLGTAAGLPSLHIERVSPEEYAKQPALEAGFASYGGRDKWALPWSTAWEGIRRGETAHVTQTLREVLGREPEPAEVTLREMGSQARGE